MHYFCNDCGSVYEKIETKHVCNKKSKEERIRYIQDIIDELNKAIKEIKDES
jgi:hypothetical protein